MGGGAGRPLSIHRRACQLGNPHDQGHPVEKKAGNTWTRREETPRKLKRVVWFMANSCSTRARLCFNFASCSIILKSTTFFISILSSQRDLIVRRANLGKDGRYERKYLRNFLYSVVFEVDSNFYHFFFFLFHFYIVFRKWKCWNFKDWFCLRDTLLI